MSINSFSTFIIILFICFIFIFRNPSKSVIYKIKSKRHLALELRSLHVATLASVASLLYCNCAMRRCRAALNWLSESPQGEHSSRAGQPPKSDEHGLDESGEGKSGHTVCIVVCVCVCESGVFWAATTLVLLLFSRLSPFSSVSFSQQRVCVCVCMC